MEEKRTLAQARKENARHKVRDEAVDLITWKHSSGHPWKDHCTRSPG